MCEVIGEVDECKKMRLDGCEWNPATQKCSLNKLTDDDGNPLVDKVGCVKCGDIKHKNTCNSMKNCFWDRITNTDGDNIGECRACSSIGDPNGDEIKVNAPWSPTNGGTDSNSNKLRKIDACDDFQLTGGQCEFRNPSNKVTGLDSDFDLFSPGFINYSNLSTQWKDLSNAVWNSITGDDDDINNIYTNDVIQIEDKDNKCKCSPTRLYPFFPTGYYTIYSF